MVELDSTNRLLVDNLKLGDHICLMHGVDEEKFSVLVPYFEKGLKNNEKCYYILGESNSELVIEQFKRRGINLEKYITSGQFVFGTENIYLTNDEFVPEKTIESIKKIIAKALEEGYVGVRTTGEGTWVLNNESARSRLIEYESKLNGLFLDLKFTAICQYNKALFAQKLLVEAIHTHPVVVLDKKVCPLNYYYTPDIFEGEHKSLPAVAYPLIVKDLMDGN
ncbi:MAG: MEDS domain-containing protein [Candidatus Nanoarchaeia archaeon]